MAHLDSSGKWFVLVPLRLFLVKSMPFLDILTRKENNPGLNTTASKIISLEDPVFALSVRNDKTLVGSYLRGSNDNYIRVLETGFKFPHRLPPSQVAWSPSEKEGATFASTSTSLRVWRLGDEKPLVKLYPANKSGTNAPCPMTGLSWNPYNVSRIATASIDTTISIWDVEKGKLETQLIAHEKPVLDVAYGNSMHQFASVSEDGSLRLFDTRDLDHSTILYEDSAPLLRVCWPRLESAPYMLSTMAADSSDIMLFDIRKSGFLLGVLRLGTVYPNAMSWSTSGCLAVGLSDGSIALSPTKLDQPQKLQPEKLISPIFSGGLTNVAWSADNSSLVVAYGSTLCINVGVN